MSQYYEILYYIQSNLANLFIFILSTSSRRNWDELTSCEEGFTSVSLRSLSKLTKPLMQTTMRKFLEFNFLVSAILSISRIIHRNHLENTVSVAYNQKPIDYKYRNLCELRNFSVFLRIFREIYI